MTKCAKHRAVTFRCKTGYAAKTEVNRKTTVSRPRLTKFEETKAHYPLQRVRSPFREKVYLFDDYLLREEERERRRKINISKSRLYRFYNDFIHQDINTRLQARFSFSRGIVQQSIVPRFPLDEIETSILKIYSSDIFHATSCASEVWRVNVTMLEIPSRNSIDSNGGRKEGDAWV